jgi:DNA-binding response OmpR family regulator
MNKKRILIVDDDLLIQKFVRVNLEARGYEILSADNGFDALRVLENEKVDLVLLDIMMPRIDGFEVCRSIRKWSQIPIIMLSAVENVQDKAKCLDYGADDYLTKPFSLKVLFARITAVLRRTGGSTGAEQTEVLPDHQQK